MRYHETMPPAYRAHLDALVDFVDLPCQSCGEFDAVPTSWYGSTTTDAYLSTCFVCGTLFELDWDEYGGDTLQSSIRHELRTDDDTLPKRGGTVTRT